MALALSSVPVILPSRFSKMKSTSILVYVRKCQNERRASENAKPLSVLYAMAAARDNSAHNNGHSDNASMRPASESAMPSSSTLADPVNRSLLGRDTGQGFADRQCPRTHGAWL
ncbi:MAG: hypothetical protein KAX57_03535 [Rhodoferax sp.]|uniref:hypothetical protein n=1 Tax=Rhodoferax sp. TaxID=50421 RepID=UPI001B636DDD|nr:hypothetical protein [Rhodoferax sp.]MBP8285891.1 hypothetical protein [Rhodoferax sp.]MBP9147991.1 hypothetical protein [Rhodoferax sp.]MBP9734113.1 hypothetical protein [Rhodoferax sp.]